jgi:hypothetical protein
MDNAQKINDENSIFKYLNPNGNDMFSKFKGLDLDELLLLVQDYILELRDNLGLTDNESFGLEIEIEYVMLEKLLRKLKKLDVKYTWEGGPDVSLNFGFEINSPVLFDSEETWEEVRKVCQAIYGNGVIGEKSGGHIHVGTQVLGDNITSWNNFLKTWSIYENIIFRFSYGEFLQPRNNIGRYAKPVSEKFTKAYQKKLYQDNLNLLLSYLKSSRNLAVNFKNVKNLNNYGDKNTIEFRCPNGTINPVIWQNNVNFFVKLLLAVKSSSFNEDTVMRRKLLLKKENINFELYDEIHLDQALELCDLIFNNNLDKVYFLRQYLKSFQIGTAPLERAKEFTLSYK